MPIVVNPGFVWPPETEPVVSPDGRITAIVDPAHAGVLLRADFDDSVPDVPEVPEKVLRRNLCTNPSFEAGTAGWNVGNRVTLSQVAIDGTITSGTKSAEVRFPTGGTNATTSMRIYRDMGEVVVPGQWVAMSAFVRRGVNAQSGLESQLYAEWATASGTYISRPMSPAQKLGTAPMAYSPSNPNRQTFIVQVPSGVGLLTSPGIRFQADGDMAKVTASDYGYVDAVQIFITGTKAEAEAAVASYFDGSTGASGKKRYRWTGPVNASESEEYTPATPFTPGHDATTAKVRFERQDGTVVRSGNPAWAPGGYAHAYDHEATLGGGTLWRAVPIMFDGTEGTPSEYVGAVIPALTDGWAWLKPVADPNKAMLLKVEPPDLSYDGRVDTTSITGAPKPAATWDVLEGFTTQLRSLVREKTVADQLMALLDEGPVLAQFPACAGLSDFYFIRGGVNLEHVHWDGYPWRRYQWDVISIDRPDTTDSPLRIPGLSYDTVERDWTTYDQLAATVDSYNKLLES